MGAVASCVFLTGLVMGGIAVLERMNKVASLYGCAISPGFTPVPFRHDVPIHTHFLGIDEDSMHIQCQAGDFLTAVKLKLHGSSFTAGREHRNLTWNSAKSSLLRIPLYLPSSPWPAQVDLETEGHGRRKYTFYIIRIDRTLLLRLKAPFGQNSSFIEERRMDYQRRQVDWYVPKISGTPRLEMQKTTVILAPIRTSSAGKGEVALLNASHNVCDREIAGFGSECALLRCGNLSTVANEEKCVYMHVDLRVECEADSKQDRWQAVARSAHLQSSKAIALSLWLYASDDTLLCPFQGVGCMPLEELDPSHDPSPVRIFVMKELAFDVTYGLAPRDRSDQPVLLRMRPRSPPPPRFSFSKTYVQDDVLFLAPTFESHSHEYTLCYREGVQQKKNLIRGSDSAGDGRFEARQHRRDLHSYDSCSGGQHEAHVERITMVRKEPCDCRWCSSYNQPSYSVVHELFPTARCAVASVAYTQNHHVALWFRACANQTFQGRTPLMAAAEIGDAEAVKLQLANAMADPNVRSDGKNETALHLATQNGHASIIKLLVTHRGKLDAANTRDEHPLHQAISLGDASVMDTLLKLRANPEGRKLKHTDMYRTVSPLMLAVEEGHVAATELLLGARADVDDDHGASLLFYALSESVRHGRRETQTTIKIVQRLLEARANVASTELTMRNTPLHVASKLCYANITKLLLEQGADVGASNLAYQTPLDVLRFSLDCNYTAMHDMLEKAERSKFQPLLSNRS